MYWAAITRGRNTDRRQHNGQGPVERTSSDRFAPSKAALSTSVTGAPAHALVTTPLESLGQYCRETYLPRWH